MIDGDDTMTRALRAYWKAARKDEKETGASWAIPSSGASGVDGLGDKEYAVLRDGSGTVLAAYRVQNSGVLKRLKRWPAAL
jgi:hypothetical protein